MRGRLANANLTKHLCCPMITCLLHSLFKLSEGTCTGIIKEADSWVCHLQEHISYHMLSHHHPRPAGPFPTLRCEGGASCVHFYHPEDLTWLHGCIIVYSDQQHDQYYKVCMDIDMLTMTCLIAVDCTGDTRVDPGCRGRGGGGGNIIDWWCW